MKHEAHCHYLQECLQKENDREDTSSQFEGLIVLALGIPVTVVVES
jgi:hypothetical protein